MGKEIHPQINPYVISRNGEWFHRNNGIGFFDPTLRNKRIDIPEIPQKPHWLVEETESLWQDIVRSNESVLATGDLGDGKSALIFGLRTTARKTDQPYVYIDGHFQDSSPIKLQASMLWAKKNNALFFWDSLDYLVIQSKKIRKKPISDHQERSNYVLRELIRFVSEGGKIIGTSHTSSWTDSYCCAEFTNGMWKELLGHMKKYEVKGVLKPKEIYDFYTAANFSPAMAAVLSDLATQQYLIKCRQIICADAAFELKEVELIEAIRKYKTAKLLALATDEQSIFMRKMLKIFVEGKIDEGLFLRYLFEYILYENVMTLKKNGALKLENV